MRALLILCVAGVTAPAVAQSIPPPTPQLVAPMVWVHPEAPPPRPRKQYVGISFDLGMPDIIGVALAVRPLSWLRTQVGGSTDLFSGGIGAAVSFIPLDGLLSPSVTMAGGHVFEAPSLGVPRAVGINADGQRIGYDYASLHAGLEIGAQQRLNVSIQLGASFVNLSTEPDGSQPTNFKTATLHVWTPSGRVALTVFL